MSQDRETVQSLHEFFHASGYTIDQITLANLLLRNATGSGVELLREQCAKIAAIEAHYWGELDDERIQLIAIGAMGAASNICAAILTERTPEQHKSDCKNRGKDMPA